MVDIDRFELKGADRQDFFDNEEPPIIVKECDRVFVEVDHGKQDATVTIIPSYEDPSNCEPFGDDYQGTMLWLNEHNYKSKAIKEYCMDQLKCDV